MLLLHCIARAIAERGLRLVTDLVPLGNALHDVARTAWEHYLREKGIGELRGEIEKIAQSSGPEIRAAAEVAAADVPPEAREAVVGYLQQMPAVIHRTLRRPDDLTGRTMPPQLSLRKADDLIAFLPERLPRFRPGDRPLPGVDWELVELLGVGGFGEVWKARNPRLPGLPPVALKFCLDAAARERLMTHEAEVITRVMTKGSHPGIVALRQAYLAADPPCLEYEYVGGGDLGAIIRSWHAVGRPSIAKVREVVRELAGAVAFAHAAPDAVVHRDLKPANILIDGRSKFKIADFGIGGVMAAQRIDLASRGTMRADLLATGLRGSHTMLYASPQQVRGDNPDPRDDVHALGVIWHQMLTGDMSQGAPTGLDWMHELQKRGMSNSEVKLIASCFESNAAKRPKDAGDLVERLEGLESKTTPTAKVPLRAPKTEPTPPRTAPPRTTPPEVTPIPKSRQPVRVWQVGCAVVVILLALSLAAFMSLTGTSPNPTTYRATWKVGSNQPDVGSQVSGTVRVKLPPNLKNPNGDPVAPARGTMYFTFYNPALVPPISVPIGGDGSYSVDLPRQGTFNVHVDRELLASVGADTPEFESYTSVNESTMRLIVYQSTGVFSFVLTPRPQTK